MRNVLTIINYETSNGKFTGLKLKSFFRLCNGRYVLGTRFYAFAGCVMVVSS